MAFFNFRLSPAGNGRQEWVTPNAASGGCWRPTPRAPLEVPQEEIAKPHRSYSIIINILDARSSDDLVICGSSRPTGAAAAVQHRDATSTLSQAN